MSAVIKIKDENGDWKSVPIVSLSGGESNVVILSADVDESVIEAGEGQFTLNDSLADYIDDFGNKFFIFKFAIEGVSYFIPSVVTHSFTEEGSQIFGIIAELSFEGALFVIQYSAMKTGDDWMDEGYFRYGSVEKENILDFTDDERDNTRSYMYERLFGDTTIGFELGNNCENYRLYDNRTNRDLEIYIANAERYVDYERTPISNIVMPEEIICPANSMIEMSCIYNADIDAVVVTVSEPLKIYSSNR